MDTVGAYEAKTNLARLLDQVAHGNVVTITRHGRSVARLVPAEPGGERPAEVVAALRHARAGVRLGGESVRDLIEEGRR